MGFPCRFKCQSHATVPSTEREVAGYYSTKPLEHTLAELTDAKLLNALSPRLTVGAANVQTAEMRYFDSRDMPLTIKHVMASGALPPAFPAVRIDDELYWDGGVLSNTPVEAVFDDNPRRSGVIFAVHMWSPNGPEPDSIQKVLARQKAIAAASIISHRAVCLNGVIGSVLKQTTNSNFSRHS